MHGFAGVVVRRDNSVLLISEPDYFTGEPYWTFPSGLIDDGERPAAAAARELAEEAGCIIDSDDLELVTVADVERHGEIVNRSWTYTATTSSPELAPRDHPDEIVTEARWVEEAEAVRLLGQSSYAPKVEPAVHFLTSGERHVHWTFDWINDSPRGPIYQWEPPSPGVPG